MIYLFKHNLHYFFVILFFWMILLENAFSFGIFHSFSNGLDIRVSLFMRILFLLNAFVLFFKGNLLIKELNHVLKLIIILFIFFIYGAVSQPQYIVGSLSVSIQTISILSIIPYLYFSNSNKLTINIFYKNLRIFALINSIFLIVSFFYPNLIEAFESSSGGENISRSFGIMGDEISIFLTFFILDSFHNKKWKTLIIFLVSFLLTGGIAATFMLFSLFAFYLYKMKFFSLKKILSTFFGLILVLVFLYNFSDQIPFVKRILLNINSPESNSVGLRLLSFTTGLNIFLDNLWFGLGFGFYGAYIKDTFSYLGTEVTIISATYNQYLQILCELGIIGFLFFISFIFKSMKQLKRKLKFNFNSNLSIAYIWLFVAFITMQSGVWFTPSSFVFLLIVCIMGINLKDVK